MNTSLASAPSPIEAVRSTMIAASQLALRELELERAYLAQLPPEHHETVRTLGVGVWLPLELALAHYRAYDAMHLDATGMDAIAVRVAKRVHGTALRTVGAIVKQTGFLNAPLLAKSAPRVWERSFRGGAIEVEILGDKAVRLRLRALGALGTSAFFRSAITSHFKYGIGLFSKQVEIEPAPPSITDTYLARIEWK